jgi:PhnB protein
MATQLNPYLSFRDNAKDAMEFYQTVFGGTLQLNTFKEFDASEDPSEDNKIMHAALETEDGITIMASDTPASMDHQTTSNISLSLSGDDEEKLREYYDKLSANGTVTLPLEKAPWGDYFGMCNDKFGVRWMVNIAGKDPSLTE